MNKCEAYVSKSLESDEEIAPKISGTKSEMSENATEKILRILFELQYKR